MNFLIRLIILLTLSLWLFGIFIEWFIPLVPHFFLLFPFLEKSYSLVCHQQQSKLLGETIYHSLVCSRCAGIYVGLFISSLASLIIKNYKEPSQKLIIFAAIPMLADVFLYSIGTYNYSKYLAFITGLLLGSVVFLYFYSAMKKLIQELNRKKN